MDQDQLIVRCSIVRGGTSKAVFIMENELPSDSVLRDKVILSLFGSPSLRQLDGLGGADPTTSKVAIIGPSSHPDADIDYTFGQVSRATAFVDYHGNCGNISSAVGPYAIHRGLVRPVEPLTTVRIHLTNSGHILLAHVRVKNGRACVDGDCTIGGVPGSGSPIELDWTGVQGAITGRLLPTGNPRDEIEIDGKSYSVSVVDAGNLVIYLRAEDFGYNGTEEPDVLNADAALLAKTEKLRGLVAQKIGMVQDWREAAEKIPYIPFVAIVAKPTAYDTYTGEHVKAEEMSLTARISVMQSYVRAFPGSGTVCTGCAARIPGSVVYDLLGETGFQANEITIGHATGTITVRSEAEYSPGGQLPVIKNLIIVRTARILMDGIAYIRTSDLQ